MEDIIKQTWFLNGYQRERNPESAWAVVYECTLESFGSTIRGMSQPVR
jgi:hypothetical protein